MTEENVKIEKKKITQRFKFVEKLTDEMNTVEVTYPADLPIGVNKNKGIIKRGQGWADEHIKFLNEDTKTSIGKPVFLKYEEPPACPRCGTMLHLLTVRVDHSPYLHCDFMMGCPEHGWTWTFGVPMLKEYACALHIFDSNAVEATKKFEELGDRECPWKHGTMAPTKVFGDWMPMGEKVEYQWKCPWCHVTHHEVIDRDYPHKGNIPLTEEEGEMLKERLRRMGYVE